LGPCSYSDSYSAGVSWPLTWWALVSLAGGRLVALVAGDEQTDDDKTRQAEQDDAMVWSECAVRQHWLWHRLRLLDLASGELSVDAGLAGASGFREGQWRLVRGGGGRVDLAVEVDGDEQMLVIIEIKGTDWDAIPADRVMRNLRRHLRQLQAYLDTAIEDMASRPMGRHRGRAALPWPPRQRRDAGDDRGGRARAGCAGDLV
jgi:hypothetical protein